MRQNRHRVDPMIAQLRQAGVELGKGKTVPEVGKVLEISKQTYYRWRQKYGAALIRARAHHKGPFPMTPISRKTR